jgi:hypothetical protein
MKDTWEEIKKFQTILEQQGAGDWTHVVIIPAIIAALLDLDKRLKGVKQEVYLI